MMMTSSWLVSAYIVTLVPLQLWNLNKPSSQNTMFGHLEPVSHCSFSPDDKHLATCSRDGSLKVGRWQGWSSL